MATFFSLDAARRIGNDNQLMKMNKLINWVRIDYKVRRINKNLGDGRTGGVMPYDALSISKSIFGYKSFATVDEEGFINKTMTVPANESEINKLEEMIIDANEFSGDKGLIQGQIDKYCEPEESKPELCIKKPKGKPMTIWQKRFNKAVSKRRFRVEQTFGTLKRRFKFTKAS